MRYPRATNLFPSRDEFVRYLERNVHRHKVDLRLGVHVGRVDRRGREWSLATSDGLVVADRVVVATGYASEPLLPHWPGRLSKPLLHAADYRNAEPFCDRDVLVVGAGSSGMEIAYDLVTGGARRVRLAVRTPPNLVLRSVGGLPSDIPALPMLHLPAAVADAHLRAMRRLLLGNLDAVGLPMPEEGVVARMRRLGVGPAVVDREVIDTIRRGRISIVPGVQRLDEDGVCLTDGSRLEPDVVIAATGYHCGLESLVGHLGVLDERGVPRIVAGREAAPGLRFVGFVPVPGQIRRSGVEARRAVREMKARSHRRAIASSAELRDVSQAARSGARRRHERARAACGRFLRGDDRLF